MFVLDRKIYPSFQLNVVPSGLMLSFAITKALDGEKEGFRRDNAYITYENTLSRCRKCLDSFVQDGEAEHVHWAKFHSRLLCGEGLKANSLTTISSPYH